jgi:hypothetical protein
MASPGFTPNPTPPVIPPAALAYQKEWQSNAAALTYLTGRQTDLEALYLDLTGQPIDPSVATS